MSGFKQFHPGLICPLRHIQALPLFLVAVLYSTVVLLLLHGGNAFAEGGDGSKPVTQQPLPSSPAKPQSAESPAGKPVSIGIRCCAPLVAGCLKCCPGIGNSLSSALGRRAGSANSQYAPSKAGAGKPFPANISHQPCNLEKNVHYQKLLALLKSLESTQGYAGLSPDITAKLDAFWDELKQQEQELIRAISNNTTPHGITGHKVFEEALPEHALTLHRLNSLPTNTVSRMRSLTRMPESNLADSDMDKVLGDIPISGVVSKDGNLYNLTKYAELDPQWSLSLAHYTAVILGITDKADFPPAHVVDFSDKSSFSMLVVGDWGTGYWQDGDKTSPAQQVMASMANHQASAAIHMGDEYYAGTPTDSDGSPGEEATNFTNLWNPGTDYSFALGSNHSMYSGEQGYKQTLASPAFAAQGGSNVFAIQLPDWVIIGLDTARYDTSTLFQDGAIDDNQKTFLQQMAATNKKIMILTHHNGISIDGTSKEFLWDAVTGSLGREPEYWLWGHKHQGIAYSSSSAAGSVRARCIGHGAIPVGKASVMFQADGNTLTPQISYYSHTPMADPDTAQEKRILNGYALLSFEPNKVTESWYNQLGEQEWSSTFSY